MRKPLGPPLASTIAEPRRRSVRPLSQPEDGYSGCNSILWIFVNVGCIIGREDVTKPVRCIHQLFFGGGYGQFA